MKILKSAFVVLVSFIAMNIVFQLTFLLNRIGNFLYGFPEHILSFLNPITFVMVFILALGFAYGTGTEVITHFKFESSKHKMYTVKALGIFIIIYCILGFLYFLSKDRIQVTTLFWIPIGVLYQFKKENNLNM